MANVSVNELGFSPKQGVNWSNYLVYRPVYQTSFFKRIFDYHAEKPGATWTVGHDIGAGCGIVSFTLAIHFDSVIISDPNDGYVTLAKKLLIEEASLPESKFTFLQETAEETSVDSGTIDLIAACECIQWTNPKAAISEFSRQLKAGGTLAITYYARPLIDGNERVQNAWKGVWGAHSKKAQGEVFDRAFRTINTALENIEFPEGEWEAIKRVYINARGDVNAFVMNNLVDERKVKEKEEKIWVEDDEEWVGMKDIEWFKAYLATWVPYIPEAEMQDVWDELELALEGKKARIRTPVVMIFATRRA
ncbi:S-adenosyl-L-methionine-dependent methyltransferase [Annulohypoxylon maeteangense]|uniref:S-adenosyl-L-methionine-dependent methyltransferase n=1 Tax=Annulohypoxylon maeteangense TaxID=1927788 RepID=UPI0020080CD4|nr:S-adenosyl-L-methionine-dependent methyltransferase [Annulohypoxylon maeteangense]KAI0889022.1 S-adenosyl-L-methionine-dependent methyltransferase [Annulohypoxylon maeteangense]